MADKRMVFGSQKDFNRFMGNYIDRLPSERMESRGYAAPKPVPVVLDKTEQLVERELEKVEESDSQEGFFSRLKTFFFGREPADMAVREVSDIVSNIEEKGPEPALARPRIQASSPQGYSRTEVAVSARRVEGSSTYAKRFEYNPDSEKDIKYLAGLVESMIRKISPGEREKFLRSSEYRIYQDVKIRHS